MQASTCLRQPIDIILAPMLNNTANPRDRILEAAARVYGEHGFRGATTRRIASAAGVNEVTLFRLFGSKAALIDEAVKSFTARPADAPVTLPDRPEDPQRELVAWSNAIIGHLTRNRSMIRKCMSELEERPEMAPTACEGPYLAAEALHTYVQRLRRAGLVNADGELRAAVAMLIGALFADAMSRDMNDRMFPQPAGKAAAMYVRLFLRSIGFRDEKPRRTIRRRSRLAA